MLTVADYEKIRKAVIRGGMSQREAARTFGHGRDTIKKALAHPSPPGYRRGKEPESPILEPVAQTMRKVTSPLISSNPSM